MSNDKAMGAKDMDPTIKTHSFGPQRNGEAQQEYVDRYKRQLGTAGEAPAIPNHNVSLVLALVVVSFLAGALYGLLVAGAA